MELPIIYFLFFSGFIADIGLALKIFVLIAIVSFIKSNLGTGPFAIILMALVAYFVIFDQWKLFGGIYVLYILFFFGLSHVLVDFFFVGQHSGPTEQEMTHIPSHNIPKRRLMR